MKKIILPAIIIILALLSGCGKPETPGFGAEDLRLILDGASFALNMSIEDVIERLGEDYEYSEAISCDYDGLDKTYIYEAAEFYTYPLPEGDLVSEIYTRDKEAATSKGIKVGAPRRDVLKAYGEDCEDTGYQIVYSLPGTPGTIDGGALCFDMENDAVTAFYVTTRTL